jgi:hypothetical protein
MTKALPRDKFDDLMHSIRTYADEQLYALAPRLTQAQDALSRTGSIPSGDLERVIKANALLQASSIASKYYDRAKDRARPGDQVSAIWEAEMMRKILAYMTDPADPVAAALSRILDRYHRQVDML